MTSIPMRTRPPVIWLTCLDRLDHAVRDEEFAGNSSGVFDAVCGATVVPASSHCAPRPPCAACGRFVLAWARTQPTSARPSSPDHRERRWTRWLCRGRR